MTATATVPPLTTCQRRFVLYCHAHGMHEGDTWHTWAYMAWIGEMVGAYKQEAGVRYISDHDDLTRWMARKVGVGEAEQMRLAM